MNRQYSGGGGSQRAQRQHLPYDIYEDEDYFDSRNAGIREPARRREDTMDYRSSAGSYSLNSTPNSTRQLSIYGRSATSSATSSMERRSEYSQESHAFAAASTPRTSRFGASTAVDTPRGSIWRGSMKELERSDTLGERLEQSSPIWKQVPISGSGRYVESPRIGRSNIASPPVHLGQQQSQPVFMMLPQGSGVGGGLMGVMAANQFGLQRQGGVPVIFSSLPTGLNPNVFDQRVIGSGQLAGSNYQQLDTPRSGNQSGREHRSYERERNASSLRRRPSPLGNRRRPSPPRRSRVPRKLPSSNLNSIPLNSRKRASRPVEAENRKRRVVDAKVRTPQAGTVATASTSAAASQKRSNASQRRRYRRRRNAEANASLKANSSKKPESSSKTVAPDSTEKVDDKKKANTEKKQTKEDEKTKQAGTHDGGQPEVIVLNDVGNEIKKHTVVDLVEMEDGHEKNMTTEKETVDTKTDDVDKTEQTTGSTVIVDPKGSKMEDIIIEEKRRRSRYDDFPTALLVCKVCQKSMSDGASFESHLSGRAHIALVKIVEERFAKRTELLMFESKLSEEEISVELERQRRAGKSTGNSNKSSNHCKMCDCNYTVNWGTHKISLGHRILKEFLHPTCRYCNQDFVHRMDWVNHLFSLSHLRRIADRNKAGKDTTIHESSSQDELFAISLEMNHEEKPMNYLTIRNADWKVPTTNQIKDILQDDTEGQPELSLEGIVIPTNYDPNVEIGREMILSTTGFCCKVCRTYMTLEKDAEQHCMSKSHFGMYVSYLKKLVKLQETKVICISPPPDKKEKLDEAERTFSEGNDTSTKMDVDDAEDNKTEISDSKECVSAAEDTVLPKDSNSSELDESQCPMDIKELEICETENSQNKDDSIVEDGETLKTNTELESEKDVESTAGILDKLADKEEVEVIDEVKNGSEEEEIAPESSQGVQILDSGNGDEEKEVEGTGEETLPKKNLRKREVGIGKVVGLRTRRGIGSKLNTAIRGRHAFARKQTAKRGRGSPRGLLARSME